MKRVQSLTVILPVIDEKDNLAILIPEINSVLSARELKYEVIVVDDGSTDGTEQLLEAMSKVIPRVRHFTRSARPKSLPQSIMDGAAQAATSHVLWMDADGSMPPETIPELLDEFEAANQPSIVVGSRFAPGGGFKGIEIVGETSWRQIHRNIRDSNDSLLAVVLSRILNKYLWLSLNRCCRDLATGFVLAERSLVMSLGLRGSYGDYCVRFLFRAHQMGVSIVEVPFINQVRIHGMSKTGSNLWDYLRRGIPYVMLPIVLRISRKH